MGERFEDCLRGVSEGRVRSKIEAREELEKD